MVSEHGIGFWTDGLSSLTWESNITNSYTVFYYNKSIKLAILEIDVTVDSNSTAGWQTLTTLPVTPVATKYYSSAIAGSNGGAVNAKGLIQVSDQGVVKLYVGSAGLGKRHNGVAIIPLA